MLLPGEAVIVAASVHKGIAYLPAMVVGGLSVLLLPGGLSIALFFLVVFGGPFALAGYLRLKTNYFALTTRRVLVTTGILRKTTREILVERIEGISVSQTLSDRVFGAGAVVVNGVGVGKVSIAGVDAAFDVRMRVATWLENRGRRAGSSAPEEGDPS